MSDEHDDDERGARIDRRMHYIWIALVVTMIVITALELLGVRPKG